ncbi:hypothetical protein HHI36_009141 [Cryptolaemus montrouzieri]|uniref:Telomere length regulation protein conserved domain-containing protein n=1 Tax=Cryptolaemus montrouzieri TaxID=559131 RepID=A0ABD2MUI0_9CUCU
MFNSLKNIYLEEHERKKIEAKIYLGLPVHLECSVEILRAIGMKTGELMLNILNKEAKEKEDIELKFEYDNLKEETVLIIKSLENLENLNMTDYYKEKQVDEDVCYHIKNLILQGEVKKDKYIPPERKFRKKNTNENLDSEMIAPTIKNNYRYVKIIDENSELDSDDDLEPYDTSNDVKLTKKEPPAYLRDLRDGLLETECADVFNLSLENCEKIIVQQLPDDDPSIGLEILEILITLEPKFFNENFENLVFQNCVAITCVYPAIYAEYLCREFHAKIGTYSVCHRVLMLNILAESARNLSSLKKSEPEETIKKTGCLKKETNLEIAQEIVRERLKSKTRYFNKFKHRKVENLNIFADCAGYFFFPLIYGFNHNKLLYENPLNESDFIVLICFLKSLGSVICAAQNCPILPKMALEALKLGWFLRSHREPKVRMMVLSLISAVVINVPQHLLLTDFMDEIFKIRLWLGDTLSSNVSRGEPNSECRALAATCMYLVDKVLKTNMQDEDNI